jgi:hypothetical protein
MSGGAKWPEGRRGFLCGTGSGQASIRSKEARGCRSGIVKVLKNSCRARDEGVKGRRRVCLCVLLLAVATRNVRHCELPPSLLLACARLYCGFPPYRSFLILSYLFSTSHKDTHITCLVTTI